MTSNGRLDPNGGTRVYLFGSNFGSTSPTGVVMLSAHACVVDAWNNTAIECEAPPGVSSAVSVSMSVGGQQAVSPQTLSYDTPTVSAFWPNTSDTIGGGNLTVAGEHFAASSLASVWTRVALTRRIGASSMQSLPCPVVASNSTALVCAMPEGYGRAWSVVVTNVDSAGVTSSPVWSTATVTYHAPTITAVALLSSDDGAPAAGGFPIWVNGTNLSRRPTVRVGSTTCQCEVGSGPAAHTAVQCTAPPLRLDEAPVVTVTVDGQSATGPSLAYDMPVVYDVTPRSMSARDDGSRSVVTVVGGNFGVQLIGFQTVPANHSVWLDRVACTDVTWVSDTMLTCRVHGEVAVGSAYVAVSVYGRGSTSNDSISMAFECPEGYFGAAGEHCATCPAGSTCVGGGADPVASFGFYPVSRSSFAVCSPPEACVGGATATCAPLYTGPRCAACVQGAFRYVATTWRGGGGDEWDAMPALNGAVTVLPPILCVVSMVEPLVRSHDICKPCPNTAWLLFLMFALAIIGLVAVSVYLSRKRLNLSILGIGVVRSRCAVRFCKRHPDFDSRIMQRVLLRE